MRLAATVIIFTMTLGFAATGDADNTGIAQQLFGIDWTGTAALRKGDGSTALQQILIESPIDDSLFRDFKLGIVYYRLHNFSTALSLLRKVVERNRQLAPIVYVYIAEIEEGLGRVGNTLAAYRSVLRGDISQRFRHYVYEKIRDIVEKDSTISIDQAPWLEDYYRWRAPQQEETIYSYIDTVEEYVSEGQWAIVDSILLNQPFTGSDACRLVKTIRAALDENSLSVKALLICSRTAHSCGELTIAEQFFDKVKKRPHYIDSISERTYLNNFAELKYDQHEWRTAIKYYKKYIAKFGNNSDAFLSIARAYRKIKKESEAAVWYERLMKYYPRHPKTREILWLRAWQNEDVRRYDRAGEYYRKIYTRFKKGNRVDESYIRHGLCFYNSKKYDSALALLESFSEDNQQSPFLLASYYWQAKCYLAKKQKSDAITILRLISYKEPFNYYAHRARQVLLELGDTTTVFIDTICMGMKVLSWFDSVTQSGSQYKAFSAQDSFAFLCGTYLASIGDIEKADFFLEPIELGFPGNLTLQYKLALLYKEVNATAQAFRIARRLTWRIPLEFRAELPLDVYRLFYPSFYLTTIEKEANNYGIDPFLIIGVMRQESIFNPQIVSPAGAIGLMQIMPYTGKYIAEKMKAPFTVDSLYRPMYNIRFGAYYIHELLEQFNGDIILALAAYNAGPHNAKRWGKENKNKELDIFVEDIGFTETRGYVKKVVSNYWTYRLLSDYISATDAARTIKSSKKSG